MKRAKWQAVAVCLAVVVGVAALTAASVPASGSAQAVKGGTYVVGWESSFGWTDGFDPTGEYLANGFAIYGSLLLRTLVGFNHVAGAPGNKPIPDLATSVPKPTNGGKVYTFHLKDGIKFGPPVNREITSADIKYALERAARPKNGAQYGFYYAVISGWTKYSTGETKTITGIKTPNSKTIVFKLTSPAGDFPFRMSMPLTAPIPPEVGQVLRGPGRQVRPRRDLVGPVHDRRLGQAQHQLLQVDQAAERHQRDAADPRPQPDLQRGDGQQEVAGEQPRPLRVPRQHERRRHLQQGRLR